MTMACTMMTGILPPTPAIPTFWIEAMLSTISMPPTGKTTGVARTTMCWRRFTIDRWMMAVIDPPDDPETSRDDPTG